MNHTIASQVKHIVYTPKAYNSKVAAIQFTLGHSACYNSLNVTYYSPWPEVHFFVTTALTQVLYWSLNACTKNYYLHNSGEKNGAQTWALVELQWSCSSWQKGMSQNEAMSNSAKNQAYLCSGSRLSRCNHGFFSPFCCESFNIAFEQYGKKFLCVTSTHVSTLAKDLLENSTSYSL